MARVRRDNGLEGSSERRLCHERKSPNTSLPKLEAKSRSTSSNPQTNGEEILPNTSFSINILKFKLGLVWQFQFSHDRVASWRSASIEAARALKSVSADLVNGKACHIEK